MAKPGPKPDPRRAYWIKKYNLKLRRRHDHLFTTSLLTQLDRCKSEEAKRLILGVSR